MFGSQRSSPRRPLLLVLVFGSLIALVGITAAAQAVLVSAHFSTSSLNATVGSDAATTRAFVNAYVDPSILTADPAAVPPASVRSLADQLATLVRPGEILAVELRRPDGTLVAGTSAAPNLIAAGAGGDADFQRAAAGEPRAVLVGGSDAATDAGRIREYLPLLVDGRVLGVVAVSRDAQPILARLADLRRDVIGVTLSAAIVAAIMLFLIFRQAQGRLTRQTAALADAARRDPLSGLLNHGALVEHLASAMEAARADGVPLGVALVDMDNFRLLNDNHGHAAGDAALLTVVEAIRDREADGIVVGRYGPDEFLLVAAADRIADLEPTLEGLRAVLADVSLQYGETERMPLTVSAGICTYPEHGDSVTVLLAAVAGILGEAKASGGDAIRVAGPVDAAGSTVASGFDVLRGLVIAVDTKDRYTKRHSEDVARYAAFLATELGLEPELVRTIERAGLLHDVGKIGIPDEVLRKPGKLTGAEYDIVKQHVALGDLIVRDVPDVDLVRAGIRHHHERWDGDGYLHRLAGDEIPLVARILAVGDAFSAMTTTRPYRKALDVRTALHRLEDAAGSQLEARLVRAFVDGIEHSPAPPLPGEVDRPVASRHARIPRVA